MLGAVDAGPRLETGDGRRGETGEGAIDVLTGRCSTSRTHTHTRTHAHSSSCRLNSLAALLRLSTKQSTLQLHGAMYDCCRFDVVVAGWTSGRAMNCSFGKQRWEGDDDEVLTAFRLGQVYSGYSGNQASPFPATRTPEATPARPPSLYEHCSRRTPRCDFV
jgi:hypothetical protein